MSTHRRGWSALFYLSAPLVSGQEIHHRGSQQWPLFRVWGIYILPYKIPPLCCNLQPFSVLWTLTFCLHPLTQFTACIIYVCLTACAKNQAFLCGALLHLSLGHFSWQRRIQGISLMLFRLQLREVCSVTHLYISGYIIVGAGERKMPVDNDKKKKKRLYKVVLWKMFPCWC